MNVYQLLKAMFSEKYCTDFINFCFEKLCKKKYCIIGCCLDIDINYIIGCFVNKLDEYEACAILNEVMQKVDTGYYYDAGEWKPHDTQGR